jgi:acyl dehydratase
VPFNELPSLKGRTTVGDPFVVTPEDQERFDVATWLDRAYAGPSVPEFPDNIIEGFYALSLVDAVVVFNTPGDRDAYWGLNYGLDRVRFVSPLWLGKPIVPTIEYLDVKPKDGGFLVLRRVTFSHEDSDRPGMVADWWGFVQPRGETPA